MTRLPDVQLSFTRHWCGRHLEPYRATWPAGAALGMLRLFEAAAAMPAVVDHAGGDAARLQATLDRFAPLCCFVSREDLLAVYRDSGVRP